MHFNKLDASYETGIEFIARGKQLTNLYVKGLTCLLESRFFSNFVTSKLPLYFLGNLTLYEGSNSENGHKGNCSLGDQEFSEKLKQYKNTLELVV